MRRRSSTAATSARECATGRASSHAERAGSDRSERSRRPRATGARRSGFVSLYRPDALGPFARVGRISPNRASRLTQRELIALVSLQLPSWRSPPGVRAGNRGQENTEHSVFESTDSEACSGASIAIPSPRNARSAELRTITPGAGAWRLLQRRGARSRTTFGQRTRDQRAPP